ncbi:MAG: YbaN family protein [Burkholderiaceae bacterium]|nr:YbaN family protein [Burkholderiaceae bacterium]
MPPQRAARLLALPLRVALMVLAVASLALGLIGVFVPGLPTTVFILIAAWAADRSSPRLHSWLLRHKLFGPMIMNWRNGGTVSRRAKWSATLAMAVCIALLFVTASREWMAEGLSVLMLLILWWLWRRPEPVV